MSHKTLVLLHSVIISVCLAIAFLSGVSYVQFDLVFITSGIIILISTIQKWRRGIKLKAKLEELIREHPPLSEYLIEIRESNLGPDQIEELIHPSVLLIQRAALIIQGKNRGEKPDCSFYSYSDHLKCAVNPKGNCQNCGHYEASNTRES